MCKAVMISIRPKWCNLIASGKKIVEIRKTHPKVDTSFKVYIYETHGVIDTPWIDEDGHLDFHGRGMVVGEFVCDYIYEDEHGEYADVFEDSGCVPLAEQKEYAPNGILYGWHISELKMYDKPKRLSDFFAPCRREYCQDTCPQYKRNNCDLFHNGRHPLNVAPKSWCYVEELTDE